MTFILYAYVIFGCILAIIFTYCLGMSDEELKEKDLEEYMMIKTSFAKADIAGEGGMLRIQILLALIFLWPIIFFKN